MKKLLCIALVLCAGVATLSAQKVKLVNGDLKPLKDVSSINVSFCYDGMAVGKFENEADYVEKKREEYNAKEPGKGDSWAAIWEENREHRYEPKFIELFEKHIKRAVSEDAEYTVVFHTIFTEPGFNVGVMRKPASIDADVLVVETANPDNVIARLTVKNAPGRDAWGVDFDVAARLSESYAIAGRELAKFVNKKAK